MVRDAIGTNGGQDMHRLRLGHVKGAKSAHPMLKIVCNKEARVPSRAIRGCPPGTVSIVQKFDGGRGR